jgi:hypothetical protein
MYVSRVPCRDVPYYRECILERVMPVENVWREFPSSSKTLSVMVSACFRLLFKEFFQRMHGGCMDEWRASLLQVGCGGVGE